jgi:hypothetical protein
MSRVVLLASVTTKSGLRVQAVEDGDRLLWQGEPIALARLVNKQLRSPDISPADGDPNARLMELIAAEVTTLTGERIKTKAFRRSLKRPEGTVH